MKEVFKVAEFNNQGELRLTTHEFDTYQKALDYISYLPSGTYQIQKVFVK